MKLTALSCGALLCALAPSVLAAPSDKDAPSAPGPAMREVEDIMTDPFVKAYFESLESGSDAPSRDGKEFKIVNGSPVKTPLPWFASINMISIVGSNGQAQIGLCGGSLINSQYVLTAAHCFYQENGGYTKPGLLQVGPTPNDVLPNILIQLGGTEQEFMIQNGMVRRDDTVANIAARASSSSTMQHRGGVQILCHPKYDPQKQINDICLVKLDTPSTQTPVKLNFETATRTAAQVNTNNSPGQQSTAFGFGDTSFQGSMSGVLLEATMPLVALADCKKQWALAMFGSQAMFMPSLANRALGNDVLCADSTKADTCQGDSGGPLLNANTGAQIGVTSMGIDCMSGIPGVYTKVSSYQDWILSVAGPAGGA